MSDEDRNEKRIYYGIRATPKKSRRANMKEAVEKNKVSYYGIKKIDSRTLQLMLKKKNAKKDLEKDKIKLVGMKGEIKRLTKDVQYIKDAKKKKQVQTDIKNKTKKYNDAVKEYRVKKGLK